MVIEFLLGFSASVASGFLLEKIFRQDLERSLKRQISQWTKELPDSLLAAEYPFVSVFFASTNDERIGLSEGQMELRNLLASGQIPSVETIARVLNDRRHQILYLCRSEGTNPVPFFERADEDVRDHLEKLALIIYREMVTTKQLYELDTYEKIKLLPEIMGGINEIRGRLAKEIEKPTEQIVFSPNPDLNYNVVHCTDWQRDGWFRVRLSFYLQSNITTNILSFRNHYCVFRTEMPHPLKNYALLINEKVIGISASGYLREPYKLDRETQYKIELLTDLFTVIRNGRLPRREERPGAICTTYGKGDLMFSTTHYSYSLRYYLNVGSMTLDIRNWRGDDSDA